MHNGDEKLVFSIDLGTTSSGVSFAHLLPGATPHVRSVTRWPGQEDAAGDSKIPSLVRYKAGKAIAYGAEAEEEPDDEGTHVARWFKLHLHPKTMRPANFEVPPLPPKVSLKQVYADLLAFLYTHARAFMQTTMHDGERILKRLDGANAIVLVLATPNGWEGAQQEFLRDAVYRAGIFSRDAALEHLQFVSEAEASVHFALERAHGDQWLQPGMNFAVLDAGGSTVDTTVYRCIAVTPKIFLEEVTGSECVQAGSVFVNRDAEKFLRMKLQSSKFIDDQYISEMMDVFEKKTKRRFDGSDESSVIAFGRVQDNDPPCSISRGRLTLTSDEVKFAFQNSISDIIASCTRIIDRSKRICDVILFVGGYSDSPYLRFTLKETLGLFGIQLITVDDGIKKAAAVGATTWYTKELVKARAVRAHFGIDFQERYDRSSNLHRLLVKERPSSKATGVDGVTYISVLFQTLASKHEVFTANKSKSISLEGAYDKHPTQESMKEFSITIYAFDGQDPPVWFYDSEANTTMSLGLRKVCKIKGDLRALHPALEKKLNPKGVEYWVIPFNVTLSFGATTLQAQLEWVERGFWKKSALQAIPEAFA